jgi:ABC-type Zn uptake system ZnuABC Zn-binding protein ZnuA
LVQSAGSRHLGVLTIGDEIDAADDAGAAGGSHASGNPHIWLDPEVARAAAGLVADRLGRVDPGGRGVYERNAATYGRLLDSAMRPLTQLTARLTNRKVVTVHETWSYLFRRFGFEVAGAVEPLPGQEPSARSLVRLVARMKAESVKVIVVEPQQNRDVADALARETGAKVVVLSPGVGGLPGTGTYLALLDYDVRTLVAALAD